MTPTQGFRLFTIAALLSSGALCLAPASSGSTADPAVGSHAVVAVIDTGIWPAAAVFADPSRTADPASYIGGYPAGTPAIGTDLAGAVRNQLYHVPGTRIVGAISLGEFTSALQCPSSQQRPIYDDCGHGAEVAQIAAAQSEDVLIVMVEAPNPRAGLRWAIEQPWIDVISLSWGSLANAPVGGGVEELTRNATEQGKVVVVAAGNGATNTALVPDRTLTVTSPLAGPPWVVSVGAVRKGTDDDYYWHSFPVDVAAPSPTGGGTSFAAPVVAGQVGRAIAEARAFVGDVGEGPRAGRLVVAPPGAALPASGPLADGLLDRVEIQDAVLRTAGHKTAQADPAGVSPAADPGPTALPGTQPSTPVDFVFTGYGIVNATSGARAVAVLLGEAPAPDRGFVETYAAATREARARFWSVAKSVEEPSISRG